MASKPKAPSQEPTPLVDVIVQPGRTVAHDQLTYRADAVITLTPEQAERLIARGDVALAQD